MHFARDERVTECGATPVRGRLGDHLAMLSRPPFLLILLVGGLASFIASHGYGVELYERAGRFAYTVPPGWQLRDHPKRRYSSMFRFKMAVDPKSNARIVVTVFDNDATSLTLKQHRDTAVQAFASQLRAGEQILAAESVFETSSGQHAVCMFFPTKTLHQWVFFFRRRDKTIMPVDCAAPAESDYDQVIEATMKTFRITRSQ